MEPENNFACDDKYSLDMIKSRIIRWAGVCGTYNRETRGAYRVLIRKPEGNRPLRKRRRRWEDIIKMCF
jgi:hypothetical protein